LHNISAVVESSLLVLFYQKGSSLPLEARPQKLFLTW